MSVCTEKRRMKMEVIESGMVTPSEETPRHTIWLSNIDLPPVPKEYTPTVYLYRPKGGDPDFFSAETLKSALSKTLVHFYPLAGRLEVGQGGRAEINCTGDGALFTVVHCEAGLDDEFFGFLPSPELRKALVPPVVSAEPPCILLMVQVTYFKSGEVILGVANHHTPQDGHSAMHFINTWAQIARRGTTDTVTPPIFDRAQLRARAQPADITDHKSDSDAFNPSKKYPAPFTTKIFPLSSEQIRTIMKKDIDSNNKKISTFQAVTCHIWRSVCKARNLSPDQKTRLFTFANTRSRVHPPLPAGFFGNASLPTIASAKAGEILSDSIGVGVDKIRRAIARVDDEYVRSHIDYLEAGKEPREWGYRSTDVTVASWLGMPIYEADFGWGKPDIMVRADMHAGGLGYILDKPDCSDIDGGVMVIMALETDHMEGFKKAFYQLA